MVDEMVQRTIRQGKKTRKSGKAYRSVAISKLKRDSRKKLHAKRR